MQKNTVMLDVEKYNELRDFKQKIEEGYTFMVYPGFSYPYVVTTDRALEEILSINKQLQNQIEDLKIGNFKKELSVSEIKRMSIWQFLKWRKS